MQKKFNQTTQYGLFKYYSEETTDFDDSKLFDQKLYIGTLLKSVKIHFIEENEKKKFLGLESSFVNFITGERKRSEYHGGEKASNEIQIKELMVEGNEYFINFELGLDTKFESIIYIKIQTNKENEIEFGENKENKLTIKNYDQNKSMIQFFFGNFDKEGINNIGFQYMDKKSFVFYRIFPTLQLRYKLVHDEEFRKKFESNYKVLLKNNIPMIFLYKACTLPESIFSKIIKYC